MSEAAAAAGPLVFVIAGEPSGDALGARLMVALRERTRGAVRFAGVGGEAMEAEGLKSLVPIQDLAIMGVAEVLPRARRIFRRVKETVAAIRAARPDAVVTIDSSGFTWRVAQRLRQHGERLLLIHYVAPMVWAWRAGRARRMARWYDHLMALLPFEPPYFQAVGLGCTYVGHPVIESGADHGDGSGFRQRYGIAADATLITVLPGSRRGEVHRLMPVFRATVELLQARYPALRVVIPTVGIVHDLVAAEVEKWPVPTIAVRGVGPKYDAFAASAVALAASGTVTLEVALAELPMVVTYRVNPITHAILRRLVNVRFANLINLVLDRPAIPELLQQDCAPEPLARELTRLIDDRLAREREIEAYHEGLRRLGRGGLSPGLQAADCVLRLIDEKRR